jgi:hypothetical protein
MASNEVTITRAVNLRSDQTSANLLTRSVAKEIFKKQPAKATLLQIIMGSRRVVDDNRLFEWYEQDLDPKWVTLTSVSSGTLTVSVADAKLLEVGMTLRQSLTQVGRITAIADRTGTPTLTLDTTSGWTNGKHVQVGAAVVEEYSSEPTAKTRVPAQLTNYQCTIRDAWGQTGWVETDQVIAGEARQHENRETALLEHKIKLDIEAWNGSSTSATTTQNSQAIKWTDGVFKQIATNIAPIPNGILTWEILTQTAQQYDRLMESPEPYMFMSRALSAIMDIVAYQKTSPNNFQAVGTEYGIHVKKLVLGNKSYKTVVVDHWAYDLGQHLVALDMKHLTLRSSKDRATGKLRWMIETMRGMDITGVDGTIGCITTDMGVKLENEEGAWMATGITAAG